MPAKNVIKIYVQNGIYHIYNRGVEKRTIFLEKNDYIYFLYLLKKYLYPKEEAILHNTIEYSRMCRYSISEKVSLLSYCLMPNHFHLLIKQLSEKSIDEFMRKICSSYSIYFNKKYKRQGTLFQGRYRAVIIKSETQLIYITKYIHLNPLELIKNIDELSRYSWSSYPDYLGLQNTIWINKYFILNLFTENTKIQIKTYRSFVEDLDININSAAIIDTNILIDTNL